MDVAVSVIVPVYNTGRFIEPCIAGMLKQTLPAEQFEVLFVDDGSTDETPARLDRLSAEMTNSRVFHEPNSGWSGRPRNVGIDNANGRYVFFCDHDDWLAPQALARLVEFADRLQADVVIPKMIGHGRGVPDELFRRTIENASFADKLMTSLTPHKLFRREFLNQIGLRFPEGKRRLEDHVFVVEAYFRSARTAVLTDYPYYHHISRPDCGNAAFTAGFDPVGYYGYVRETLDIIDRYTEPGAQRDAILDRPFGGEMLVRLRGRRMRESSQEDQRLLMQEVRTLMHERFAPDFADHLPAFAQATTKAVKDDNLEALLRLDENIRRVKLAPVATEMTTVGDAWQLALTVDVRFEDGEPLLLRPAGDGWSIDDRLIPDDCVSRPITTDEALLTLTSVVLASRGSYEEWFTDIELRTELVPIAGDPTGAVQLRAYGDGLIDPARLRGGSALTKGTWDVVVSANVFGVRLRARVQRPDRDESFATVNVGPRDMPVLPFLTAKSAIAIDVGRFRSSLIEQLFRGELGPAQSGGGQIRLSLGRRFTANLRDLRPTATLVSGDAVAGIVQVSIEQSEHTEADSTLIISEAVTAASGRPLPSGQYSLHMTAAGTTRAVPVGAATVGRSGSVTAIEWAAPTS